MLSIKTTICDEIVWYVGQPLHTPTAWIEDVVNVQADGDELDAIANLGITVPTNRRSVMWFGDQAKFIVANLRN